MGLATSIALAMAVSGPLALAPSGKWIVDYRDNMCVLQRSFGEGDSKLVFGLQPYPIGSTYEVVLMLPEIEGRRVRSGRARLTLSHRPEPVEADYVSVRTEHGRLAAIRVDALAMPELAGVESLAIELGDDAPVKITPTQMAPALKALETCQTDLQRHLGLDPSALAAIATPAEPTNSPAHWITNYDYPRAALSAGLEGVSSLIWMVGADGRVSDCQVVASSGHAILDDTACAAMTRRGRYKPALDKDGRPMRSWESRRIRWSVPN